MPADRYITLPIGYVFGAEEHATIEAALAHASKRASSDRAPRAVLRVVAEVQPNAVPQVQVSRFDREVANG